MKRLFSFSRLHLIPVAGFVLLIFLFSACKKTVDTGARQPAAGLMAFNLVPDKASIGVALSGNNFTNVPLFYTSYTGGYQGVFLGNRDVSSYDFSSHTTLATTTQLFKDSAYYSLFVLGNNGNYSNIIVQDNLDSLSSTTGEAYVRFVNAIPDSSKPMVTISTNGTNVINSNAAYATVSDFTGVTPGDISITVTNESTINTHRTISVEGGKIYTILLTGIPGETDAIKAVQIKFITNGTIKP
ncbi:MAG: DUF4397 domain-containing protein [Ginsengibacter sp.]